MLREYWLFLLPLIIAQFALMITALVHIFKHQPQVRIKGNVDRHMFLFQMIGPIVFCLWQR